MLKYRLSKDNIAYDKIYIWSQQGNFCVYTCIYPIVIRHGARDNKCIRKVVHEKWIKSLVLLHMV